MNRTISLRSHCMIILIMIIAQYMLGVYVERYTAFPNGARGTGAWTFALSQSVLVIHIALGTLIGIAALIFLIRAFRAPDAGWKIPAATGLIGVAGTGISASQFVSTQSGTWSFFMTIFFALAFFSYLWGYSARRSETSSARRG